MFGNPETTTGGRALKFYASVRFASAGCENQGGDTSWRTHAGEVSRTRSHTLPRGDFDVMYGEGISREGDLLDLAVDKRIVEKSGHGSPTGGEVSDRDAKTPRRFTREPENSKD